jgi:hypothetical protein
MKKVIIHIVIVLLVSTSANGQVISLDKTTKEKVSGYLGKKNIVQVRGIFSTSDQPQKSYEEKRKFGLFGLTINKEYGVNIDRVLSNKHSLGIIIGTSSTSMKFKMPKGLVEMQGSWLNSINSTPTINDKYFGAKFKLYNRKKGGLSPIGRYWTINANIHNYVIDMKMLEFMVFREGQLGEEFVPFKLVSGVHKYTLMEFGVSVGMNRVIAKRLILDYGAQSSFVQVNNLIDSFNLESDTNPLTVEDFVRSSILKRISRFNLLKFYISAGFVF